MKLSGTKKITYTAVFTAIIVVLNVFSFVSGIKYFKISFVATGGFLAGVFLSPVLAFVAGFLGDFLGFLILTDGVYNPVIGIASGLLALVPAIVFNYSKLNVYLNTIISFVLTTIICTMGINTIALWLMLANGKSGGVNFFDFMFLRLPMGLLNVAMNFAVCIVVVKYLFLSSFSVSAKLK